MRKVNGGWSWRKGQKREGSLGASFQGAASPPRAGQEILQLEKKIQKGISKCTGTMVQHNLFVLLIRVHSLSLMRC